MVAIQDPRIPSQWHVFRSCQWETREILRNRYRILKKTGKISGAALTGGIGLWGVAKEIGKDVVVYHGKRGLGSVIIVGAGWLCPIPVKLVTNSTKIVKCAMCVSNTAAACLRASENLADMPLIVCDYFLFGEYVPTNRDTSYNLFNNNVTDVADQIANLGGK